MRLPNFIGIGAPKAGTTWLFRCLRAHPEVYVTPVKETDYFDYCYDDVSQKTYEDYFSGATSEDAIGEISTCYLSSAEAPFRIHRDVPQVRLFVSLRNPIDQVYSHYWHLSRQNFHQEDLSCLPQTFEEAISLYRDKLLEPARYAKHLHKWLSFFDASQIHVLFYDDIKKNPQTVLNDLYSFLDVHAPFYPQHLNEQTKRTRQGTSLRNTSLRRIRAISYKYLDRLVYAPMKRLLGYKRAARLKEAIGARQILESVFNKEGYPEMEEATRQQLGELFEEDISEVEHLTGRKLTSWRVAQAPKG